MTSEWKIQATEKNGFTGSQRDPCACFSVLLEEEGAWLDCVQWVGEAKASGPILLD